MKKLLLALPIFILFSCASAPETGSVPEETTAVQAAAQPVVKATAEKEKNRAIEAMNKAKSIKAEVAVKDEFNKALGIFNEAETLSAGGAEEIAAAAGKYLESEGLFLTAYENAKVKKEEAIKQLNKAKDDIKNVEDDAAAMEAEQSEEKSDGEGGGV